MSNFHCYISFIYICKIIGWSLNEPIRKRKIYLNCQFVVKYWIGVHYARNWMELLFACLLTKKKNRVLEFEIDFSLLFKNQNSDLWIEIEFRKFWNLYLYKGQFCDERTKKTTFWEKLGTPEGITPISTLSTEFGGWRGDRMVVLISFFKPCVFCSNQTTKFFL